MSQLLDTEVSAIQRCPLFRGFHIRFCTNSCRSKKMCAAIRRCPLLASPLLGAFTVYTSEVSIELQTSVVETTYICLMCSHMYIYSDSFNVNLFVYIFHNLETSSNELLPIANSILI